MDTLPEDREKQEGLIYDEKKQEKTVIKEDAEQYDRTGDVYPGDHAVHQYPAQIADGEYQQDGSFAC